MGVSNDILSYTVAKFSAHRSTIRPVFWWKYLCIFFSPFSLVKTLHRIFQNQLCLRKCDKIGFGSDKFRSNSHFSAKANFKIRNPFILYTLESKQKDRGVMRGVHNVFPNLQNLAK